jgi:hypothetical protein
MNRFAPKIAKAIALASFSALSMLAVAPAKAVVIDFESLAVNDIGYQPHGSTYTESNFTINSVANYVEGLITWDTQSLYYANSTALLDNYNQGISLSQVGGGTFTLSSIDLTDTYNGSQSLSTTFTGKRADNTYVTQSFTTDSLPGMETFTFSNFTNLVSVDWISTGGDNPSQFDNINVTPTLNTTSVPEPFTVLGTIFGAGYGIALKRKLAKAQQDKEDIS